VALPFSNIWYRRGRRSDLSISRDLPRPAIPDSATVTDDAGFVYRRFIGDRRLSPYWTSRCNFAVMVRGILLYRDRGTDFRTTCIARSAPQMGKRRSPRPPHDIVGADKNGERLITALRAQEGSNVDILGVFDDRGDGRAQEICAGVSKLGKVDDILEFAYRTRVDLILFALPISAEKRILQMLRKLWVLPVDIHLSAHASELRFRPRYYSNLAQTPTLPMFEKPITDWDMVMKWAFDRVVGMLLLVIAAPLMAIVALAIKLDSKGPIFFRQQRFGFNNEKIGVLKFRSLYHDCADPRASKVVTKNDPRVTRVGRFIRKTSSRNHSWVIRRFLNRRW
jgi:Bacterial sugar transferase/CoA-binding domain